MSAAQLMPWMLGCLLADAAATAAAPLFIAAQVMCRNVRHSAGCVQWHCTQLLLYADFTLHTLSCNAIAHSPLKDAHFCTSPVLL
jgi:hypothetical protein